jgi:two-component system sensor histidine kinase/response regulator
VNTDAQNTLAILRGKRALVVDDNAFNLEVACDLLRDIGMEVEVAANGALAIEALQNAAFDAVLMDVQMPVMDGHEATRRIRKDPKLAHTVVLGMTANAGPEDQALCLQAGMGEVITKPIEPDVLFATLARWIGKTQATGTAKPVAPEAEQEPNVAPPAVARMPATPAPAAPSGAHWEQFAAWDAMVLPRIVGDNPATQQRLLSKYRITATETVTGIRISAAGADWAEVSELAHKLKSSSRSVGALRLGALCEALEREGRVGAADTCAPLVPLVMQAFDDVLASLDTRT